MIRLHLRGTGARCCNISSSLFMHNCPCLPCHQHHTCCDCEAEKRCDDSGARKNKIMRTDQSALWTCAHAALVSDLGIQRNFILSVFQYVAKWNLQVVLALYEYEWECQASVLVDFWLHNTTQFLFLLQCFCLRLAAKAFFVASLKMSSTFSWYLAEHSRYSSAFICCRVSSPCIHNQSSLHQSKETCTSCL